MDGRLVLGVLAHHQVSQPLVHVLRQERGERGEDADHSVHHREQGVEGGLAVATAVALALQPLAVRPHVPKW